MRDRFANHPGLLVGPTAYVWLWTFIGQFSGTLVIGVFGYLTVGSMSDLAATICATLGIAFLWLSAISWGMLFYQRKRERRAGYTTLWAGEEDRQLDEVDPSTGVIIRRAGDTPTSNSRRLRASC